MSAEPRAHEPWKDSAMQPTPTLTAQQERHLMVTLDAVANLNGNLGAETRARIYTAVASASDEAWVSARTAILNPVTLETLWQATLRTAGRPLGIDRPSPEQIMAALEDAAVEVAMEGVLL